MTPTNSTDAIEYLEAKKPIDDRSLNRHVWDELWRNLPGAPLRILELGAGIGTMLERLIERDRLTEAHYTAVDLDEELLEAGRSRLMSIAKSHGLAYSEKESGLELSDDQLDVTVSFLKADITQDIDEQAGSGWDLLIGNAILDLVDIQATLPDLLHLIQPNGMFYFTITFDGLTHFGPVIDPDLDRTILQHYHQTMDERRYHGRAAGHSQSGRLLLAELQRLGTEVVAAGSSDWVVYPKSQGYSDQEERFLGFILDTVEGALEKRQGLNPKDLRFWLEQRRRQLDEGKLIYLAHQIDVCGFPSAQVDPG